MHQRTCHLDTIRKSYGGSKFVSKSDSSTQIHNWFWRCTKSEDGHFGGAYLSIHLPRENTGRERENFKVQNILNTNRGSHALLSIQKQKNTVGEIIHTTILRSVRWTRYREYR
jgi:hypothetical protein